MPFVNRTAWPALLPADKRAVQRAGQHLGNAQLQLPHAVELRQPHIAAMLSQVSACLPVRHGSRRGMR